MGDRFDLDSLWVAARGGEQVAFEALVTALHPAVFRIVLGIVGDYQEAEDVTQEVFLRAHLALPKLSRAADCGAWLRRIAINAEIDRLRRRRRQRWWPWASRPLSEELPERPQRPEDELADQVRRAFQKLPEHYRVVAALRELDGLSYEEIARVLGCPVGTVRSRLARARERLKKLLAPFLRERS